MCVVKRVIAVNDWIAKRVIVECLAMIKDNVYQIGYTGSEQVSHINCLSVISLINEQIFAFNLLCHPFFYDNVNLNDVRSFRYWIIVVKLANKSFGQVYRLAQQVDCLLRLLLSRIVHNCISVSNIIVVWKWNRGLHSHISRYWIIVSKYCESYLCDSCVTCLSRNHVSFWSR